MHNIAVRLSLIYQRSISMEDTNLGILRDSFNNNMTAFCNYFYLVGQCVIYTTVIHFSDLIKV